jgi:hypothetical protein
MDAATVTIGGTVYVPAKSVPEVKPEPKPEPPIPPKKELAQHIVAISSAVKSLTKSGLNQDAVLTLLVAKCPPIRGGGRSPHKLTRNEVQTVLRALADLEKAYCMA